MAFFKCEMCIWFVPYKLIQPLPERQKFSETLILRSHIIYYIVVCIIFIVLRLIFAWCILLTEIASDGLKGRVFEISLADLQNDEVSFRKFKLMAEDVQGRNVLTNFHGMDLTRDKLCSMVKKWQTLIEANVDVRTTDGYLLRMFCIGFTKKKNMQVKKTCYAQHTQVIFIIGTFN